MTIGANPNPSYNFDMKALLNNLRAYNPSKVHVETDIDQDSDAELEHIATYILMRDHSIIIDTVVVGRK